MMRGFGKFLEDRAVDLRFKPDTGLRQIKHAKKRRSNLETKNLILAILLEHGEKPMGTVELSNKLGYTSSGRISKHLIELRQSGHIRLIEGANAVAGISNTYRVLKHRVNSKQVPEESPKVEPTVRLSKAERNMEKIYDFVERHQGQFLSQSEIAEAVDLSQPAVSTAIRRLVRDGFIERSEPTAQGRRYRIPGNDNVPDSASSPNAPVEKPVEEPVAESNDSKFLGLIDPLVWEFVKASKSTDILVFLEWLEKNKR